MTDKPKGGFLARDAAMLCQNATFRLYLDQRARVKFSAVCPDHTHEPDDARDFILQACDIESRAELDHNGQAATTYRKIKYYFQRWADRESRKTRTDAAASGGNE